MGPRDLLRKNLCVRRAEGPILLSRKKLRNATVLPVPPAAHTLSSGKPAPQRGVPSLGSWPKQRPSPSLSRGSRARTCATRVLLPEFTGVPRPSVAPGPQVTALIEGLSQVSHCLGTRSIPVGYICPRAPGILTPCQQATWGSQPSLCWAPSRPHTWADFQTLGVATPVPAGASSPGAGVQEEDSTALPSPGHTHS